MTLTGNTTTTIIHPYDELKSWVGKGEWWIATKEGAKHLPGDVTISTINGSELELIGALSEELMPYAVVRGCVNPAKHVLLINGHARSINRSFGAGVLTQISQYHFLEAWIGEVGFDSSDDICFDAYSFGITNLDVWRNIRSFQTSNVKFGEPIVTTYTPPKPLLLYKDDVVKIELIYQYQTSNVGLVQNSMTIEHLPRICISSLGGRLPYYGETRSFHYYEHRMATFLGLLIGSNAVEYGRCGFRHRMVKLEEGKFIEVSDEVVYYSQREFPEKVLKQLDDRNIFVPFGRIENELVNVIANFFKATNEVVKIASRIISFRSLRTAMPYDGVPELVFMFEGLARNLYVKDVRIQRSHMPGYLEHQANSNRIKEVLACDKALCEWAMARLKFKAPDIALLFETARGKLCSAMPNINDGRVFQEVVEWFRARRDGFAHTESKIETHAAFSVPAYHWMEAFLMSMILISCGVADKIVAKGVKSCADFRWAINAFNEEFCSSSEAAS